MQNYIEIATNQKDSMILTKRALVKTLVEKDTVYAWKKKSLFLDRKRPSNSCF